MADKIPDIEEALLEETQVIDGLVPATQAALDLPDCKVHDFVFLRSAKTKKKTKGSNTPTWTRTDTFYCSHCLRYTMMDRSEPSGDMPVWYRDDR